MTRPNTTLTAQRTILAGVGRVNVDHVDASPLRLVFDKVLKLTKRPAIEAESHLFEQAPVSDVGQVFQHEGISWLKRIHNLLADVVVHITHPSVFSARQLFKHPATAGCAFALKRTPNVSKAVADVCRLLAGKLHARTCAAQIDDTKVNTDDLTLAPGGVGRGTFLGQHDVDVKVFLALRIVDGRRRWFLALEQPKLIVADGQGYLAPACNRRNRNRECIKILFQAKQVFVQIKRRWPEQLGLPAFAFRGLDSPRHAGETTTNVVGSQTVSLFERVVALVVERDVVRDPLVKCHLKRIVASLRILQHRISQGLRIFWCDFELAFNGLNDFHDPKYTISEVTGQGGNDFSPVGLRSNSGN